jgi:hypothetical protein
LGWWCRTRTAKKRKRKQIRAINFAITDVSDRVRKEGRSALLRSVRGDANVPQTVAPLEMLKRTEIRKLRAMF